jgi:hypothetical protein
MLLKYGALCEGCDIHVEYEATYENKDLDLPLCPRCGDDTIRVWMDRGPYTPPESLFTEGTGIARGKKVRVNDSDDPWEGTLGLEVEASEEFVAKRAEMTGKGPSNWGDRKGTIVFDGGATT